MISIDSHESFSPWIEKPEVLDSPFDNTNLESDDLDYFLSSSGSRQYADEISMAEFLPIDLCDLEIDAVEPLNFGGFEFSPAKPCTLEDYNRELLLQLSSEKSLGIEPPVSEKQHAPLSPDSGIGQDQPGASFEDCDAFIDFIGKEFISLSDLVKVSNDSELGEFIDSVLDKGIKSVDADSKSSVPPNFSNSLGYRADRLSRINIESSDLKQALDKLKGFECSKNDSSENHHWLDVNALNSKNDSSEIDHWLDANTLNSKNDSSENDHWLDANALNLNSDDTVRPLIDLSSFCTDPLFIHSSTLLKETKPIIKVDDNLFVLRNDSRLIEVEHSYCKKPPCVVDSDEEDEPVKKRKRSDVDEDFSPYQKPKRKAGRPRTNFSKPDTQKTQRLKTQKTKAPKRTSQASKKIKSCSSVPFDRREQHNQAERERRDMLKKNLDIVEDITPDHVLHLTQIALQSEKTGKSDELENNENNFTVDVLKRLDELMKKEPVSHRPKYKKASRNSKMVVLLGSTYYIGSLDKELKVKESRLAQLKKQYEDCLKRFNPKGSKKIRRNY